MNGVKKGAIKPLTRVFSLAFGALLSMGALGLVFVFISGSAETVNAAALDAQITYTVTSNMDTDDGLCDAHCTLREALTATNNNPGADTILFDLMPLSHTIVLTDGLLPAITDILIIDGSNVPELTISGNDQYQIFNSLQTAVTLTHMSIVSGTAALGGGVLNSGALTLNHVTLKGNHANRGGGIYNDGGLLVISDTLLTDNDSVEAGGGIFNHGVLILNDTDLTVNATDGIGGGIFSQEPSLGFSMAEINRTTFLSNTANHGGGIYVENPFLTMTHSLVSNNTANLYGGGMINGSEGIISHTVFLSNTAAFGGGINNDNKLVLHNNTFQGNWAYEYGGGVLNSDTFFSTAVLTVTNSTFSNNFADYGGGLANRVGHRVTVNNSTFNGNTAYFSGGGISNTNALELNNVTLSGNGAPTGGNLINSGTMSLTNSILANNSDGGDCRNSGSIALFRHNLVEDTAVDACDQVDGTNGNIIGQDPLLGSLVDNGGPEVIPGEPLRTHALLSGSPAIDSGDDVACLDSDQRGLIRPQDGNADGVASCDIGAFELESPLVISKEGPLFAEVGELITYTLTVQQNLPFSLSGVVITDALPVGATYIGGGLLVGNVVSWSIPSLGAGTLITRQFTVTATERITNTDYRVSASGGYVAKGNVSVITDVSPEPIAGLIATNSSPVAAGDSTTLTATIAQGTDVNYVWSYGDGQSGNGAVVDHVYPTVGVYTAVVTASNSTNQLTATTRITVAEAITELTLSNNSPTTLGRASILTATITTGSDVAFLWDFADGEIGHGNMVSHTYLATGVYTAVVTASNSVSSVQATTMITIIQPGFTVYLPIALKP